MKAIRSEQIDELRMELLARDEEGHLPAFAG